MESEENCTPPDVFETAKTATNELLPAKSRGLYERRYNEFIKWCESKKIKKYSENVVLAYLSELGKVMKPPTLWSVFSMIKATLLTKENINLGEYKKVIAFLKQKQVGYKPKKSKVLSKQEVIKFLQEAPDDTYLMIKVALIIGVSGACRRHELYELQDNNIKNVGNMVIVTIPQTKTYQSRTFTIINDENVAVDYVGLFNKYANLRSNKSAGSRRFFFKFANGRCVNQVVGINTFGRLPSIIAEYLNLEDANLYTGHCFRRSSATILANSGANITKIKRHGGWRSTCVAEGYIEESLSNKIEAAQKILGTSPSGVTPGTSSEIHHFSQVNTLAAPAENEAENQIIQSTTSTVVENNIETNLKKLGASGVNIQHCSNFTLNVTINNKC